jgi:preprotein translocase subunit YajC
MRVIIGALAAAGLFAAAPAVAQAQAPITVGMQVTDASGGMVGTVAGITGPNLLIKTDKHEAQIPRSSFSVSNGKLLFGMTQAQLDAQIEQSSAAASAAIVAGATVKGVGGTPVGTIESVADGNATIALQNGKKIAVPQSGLRGNPDHTVTIGYTEAQLEALVQGGASSTDASSAAAASNTQGK